MDLELKKRIIEVGFGFDELTISEVIEMCFDIDGEDTENKLIDIQNEYPNEI